MARNVRISCVNQHNRQRADERISHVGGINRDERPWKLTLDEAIKGLEDRKWNFYVELPAGDIAWVVVATSAAGIKYLKTEADDDQPNNLLALSECP